MRKVRLTYPGAFHHVMNRGIKGEDIYGKDKYKDLFLQILTEKKVPSGINLFAYCIMNNHYHLILKNTSGNLSKFMQDVNSKYAMIYRKYRGGRGYVFQDRFKSTLIQEDEYLKMAIIYVLLNPVRSKIVKDPFLYHWSSIDEYFSDYVSDIVDNEFVESIFQKRENLVSTLNIWINNEGLSTTKTRYGDVFGEEEFRDISLKIYDRRKNVKKSPNRRLNDNLSKNIKFLLEEFENEEGIKINEIDVNKTSGRKLREKLIIKLREQGDISYNDINILEPFKKLKFSYLGRLYKISKEKMQKCKPRP